MTKNASRNDLLTTTRQSLADGVFVKLSLGGYQGPEKNLKNITARHITVKRDKKLSLTYRYQTRDIVKNYNFDEALEKISTFLNDGFTTATLFTTAFDLKLESGKLKKSPPTHTEAPSLDHDHAKNRPISADKPYLHALGIADESGKILKSSQDKYRQINRYIEILAPLLQNIEDPSIADMGAGKGYLTFALYDYLTSTLRLKPAITGIETRADLVDLCNKIASDSNFTGLRFIKGTIENFDAASTNMLIALHACDTATDDAIQKGIECNAQLIVVAPCCHKQIRRAMEKNKTPGDLAFLLRHGIFLERQAEMVTDSIRALILEYFGYSVKVFEFVSNEHTAKNVMITAVKNPAAKRRDPAILQKIHEAKKCFGITCHSLEKIIK